MELLERDRRKAACVSAARCLALFELQRAEMEEEEKKKKRGAGFSAPSLLPLPPPPPLLLAIADRVETALTPLLASMEHRGVLVDVAALAAERAFLRKVQAAAVERLCGLAGERAARLAVQAAAGNRAASSSSSSSTVITSPALRRLVNAARDRARAQVGALNLEAPADVSQLLFDWLGLSPAVSSSSGAAAEGAAAGGRGVRVCGGSAPLPLPPQQAPPLPPPPPLPPRQRGRAPLHPPTNARALAPLAARGEPGVLLVQAGRGARKREEEVQLLLDRCAVTAAVAERERRKRRKRRKEARAPESSSRGGGANDKDDGDGNADDDNNDSSSSPLLCRLSICLRQTAANGGRLIVDTPSLQTLPKAIDYSIAFAGGGGGGGGEGDGRRGEEAAAAAAPPPPPEETTPTPASCISNARNAVVPPRGGLLVSADYAQMELRLAAHLSNDAALLACFGGGGEGEQQQQEEEASRDPMRVVAAAIFFRRPDELLLAAEEEEEHRHHKNASNPSLSISSLPATPEAIQAVTPQQRDAAKRLVYGLMYGMGDAALADALALGSEAEAARVRERVGGALPGLAAWMEGIDRRAAEEAVEFSAAAAAGVGAAGVAGGGDGNGGGAGVVGVGGNSDCATIATLCGRRWQPSAAGSAPSGNVEGRARSFVVQGSASDVFKRALLAVDEAFRAGVGVGVGERQRREGGGNDGSPFPSSPPPPIFLPAGAARVLLPLHDEILIEVSDERHARAAAAVLRERMEGVARELGLRVALPVKVKAGARWGAMRAEEDGW